MSPEKKTLVPETWVCDACGRTRPYMFKGSVEHRTAWLTCDTCCCRTLHSRTLEEPVEEELSA